MSYSYGEVLLSIKDVSLFSKGQKLLTKPEPNAHPILRNINKEMLNIVRDPGSEKIQGQVVSFIGPSGSGKTQLFRLIAGLNKPTTGSIHINGSTEPVKAGQVGVVAQNYRIFDHRTVMDNLMLAATMKEKDHKVAHDRIKEYLNEFEIYDRASLYPAQISGGQRQRVAIIQQILCSEHFLLMDEPFSGLDIIQEEKCIKMALKVANMDDLNTVIIVTHDVTAAVSVADHIWALGRDRNTQGEYLPGAYIKYSYDLMAEGLCYAQIEGSAQVNPKVAEFIRHVKSDFLEL